MKLSYQLQKVRIAHLRICICSKFNNNKFLSKCKNWEIEALVFFVNWQIWHFCHSCTKLTSRGLKISKKKLPPLGIELNTNPTIEIPATLPTQPICQSMSVSNFQTLIKSCSIESEMIQVQFMKLVFNRCLCGWMGKVAGFLIVGLVLWVQYQVKAIFFCWFWNPVMLILYKNDRNVRSVNLRKTRVNQMSHHQYLAYIVTRGCETMVNL